MDPLELSPQDAVEFQHEVSAFGSELGPFVDASSDAMFNFAQNDFMTDVPVAPLEESNLVTAPSMNSATLVQSIDMDDVQSIGMDDPVVGSPVDVKQESERSSLTSYEEQAERNEHIHAFLMQEQQAGTTTPLPAEYYPSSGSDGSGNSVPGEHATKGTKRKQSKLASKLPPPQKPQENMTEEEKKEFKRKQRLLRNRVSAQLSRERKKAYVTVLEEQMREMAEKNKMLTAKLNELSKQNATLRQRLDVVQHSDDNSASSADTPVFYTVGSDDADEPGPIKRHKAAARTRTGVVLFALAFSFGVFFHMSGADLSSQGPHMGKVVRLSDEMAITPGVFRGRVLQSLAATEADQAPIVQHSVETRAVRADEEKSSDVREEEEDSALHVQPVHMSTLSKQLQNTIVSLGKTFNHTSLPSVHGKVDPPAPVYINGDPSSRAVQHYDEQRNSVHKVLADALNMYRTLYLKENNNTMNDMPSSILFCPSPIHVYTKDVSKAVTPVNGNASLGDDASNMLLWVPSNMLSTGWKDSLPRRLNDVHRQSEVTEMKVSLEAIRSA